MARDYKREYQRRVELAKQRGFKSVRQASRTKRDYALERERANIRANSLGFRNASARARFNRIVKQDPTIDREKWQKKDALNFFGISERKFNQLRKENRQWSREYPLKQWTGINTYDTFMDERVHDWSEQRVGYILAFHGAIVDPDTNYESLTRNHKREIDPKTKRPKTNRQQFDYLVKYARIMTVDEFEARYGSNH